MLAAIAFTGLLAVGASLIFDDHTANGTDDGARDRAGALCTSAHDRLATLPPLNDVHGIATAGPEVVDVTVSTARQLLELDAPAERAASIRAYARRLLRQASLTSRLQQAARARDRRRAVALIEQITANSRAGRPEGAAVAPECGGIVRPSEPATPTPQAV